MISSGLWSRTGKQLKFLLGKKFFNLKTDSVKMFKAQVQVLLKPDFYKTQFEQKRWAQLSFNLTEQLQRMGDKKYKPERNAEGKSNRNRNYQVPNLTFIRLCGCTERVADATAGKSLQPRYYLHWSLPISWAWKRWYLDNKDKVKDGNQQMCWPAGWQAADCWEAVVGESWKNTGVKKCKFGENLLWH